MEVSPNWTGGKESVLLGRAVAGLDGVGLGHVLALLGLAVIAATGLVINAGVRIHPNHAVTIGRRSLLTRGGFCGGIRCGRRGF